MTKEIIHGISGAEHIFGGDLSAVVRFLKPTLQRYNRDNEEVFNLTNNMYNISNILFTSYEAWTELTDFGQRYQLSSNILANIDNTGFLFLSETMFSTMLTHFNQTVQFSFQTFEVILDIIDPTQAISSCYKFNQVRNQHLHIISVSCRALSVFLVKLGAAPLVLVMWSSQPSSSTTATISYSQPSKPIHSPICPASSASLLTTTQRWSSHRMESQSE